MFDLVSDSAARLFEDHRDEMIRAMPVEAESGAVPFQADLWRLVEDHGFGFALLSEDEGGFGLSTREALGIVRLAGENAIPLPIGETMMAHWLCVRAGLETVEGPASVALLKDGLARRVAYGRDAASVVLIENDGAGGARLAKVDPAVLEKVQGHNAAGEPRDDMTLAGSADWQPSPVSCETLRAIGAMLRAVAMAGAMEQVVRTTIAYSRERVQFGRPLQKFQVLQHNMAMMASQCAAATAAAGAAVDGFAVLSTAAPGGVSVFESHAAAAKLRVGEAAGIVAGLAHQIIGAIGFSHEFPLHPYTRRLRSWRDEWGSESAWARRLGAQILAGGACWPQLTELGDAIS